MVIHTIPVFMIPAFYPHYLLVHLDVPVLAIPVVLMPDSIKRISLSLMGEPLIFTKFFKVFVINLRHPSLRQFNLFHDTCLSISAFG